MSFSQAVSGLNAAAANLDTIGNNISNSATYGFKGATVSFADVFAGSGAGLGVKYQALAKTLKMVVSRLLTAQPMWRFLVVVSSVLKIVTVAFSIHVMVNLAKIKTAISLICKACVLQVIQYKT